MSKFMTKHRLEANLRIKFPGERLSNTKFNDHGSAMYLYFVNGKRVGMWSKGRGEVCDE